MTNAEKELLLKDLSARLPYGVKVLVNDSDGREYTLKADYGELFLLKRVNANIKPYLRPMESMTELEKEEFDNFVVIDESAWNGDDITGFINQSKIMSQGIAFLLSHHLDYNGLIEKGIALPAKEGMYNN